MIWPEYDWVTLWRSILTLSGFIVSKLAELRLVSDKVNTLVAQVRLPDSS